MNHSTLEIFKIVAQEHSVTRAAKRLGRAQSNITTRIQQLEEELDVELFVRGNKKMLLSAAGERFLDYTLRILSLAEEAKQALHPTQPAGSLRMGAMEAAAASRLTSILPRFHQQCPAVALTLQTMPTRQLVERVLSAALDCALVSLPPDASGEPECPAALEYLPLFAEELVLITPAGQEAFRLAAFAQGCSYRQRGEAFLSAVKNVEVQEIGSYHAVIACIASGGYAGIVPQSVLALMTLPEGCETQPVGTAMTQLVWRKGYASPALDAMRQQLLLAADI
ncbi:LysR family transcriptional regulator [Raoultella terrigena]|uniref:HTH-type transcriptional regulator YofA n=1 Tax=Raoultella terrigena TaxID=577 RepID=A0A485BHH5_RAOTE|nr:LysR family transcriptional regulator [Raoultella terrigena]NWK87807.1 LysR family transcriptional regulator [Raoultella terrigena]GEC65735.1 LysR family transcriptional regulator [Raoultella terrigena]VFS72810.1 HTH-type transcriptional regulator YofA [Raoultella terrigena]